MRILYILRSCCNIHCRLFGTGGLRVNGNSTAQMSLRNWAALAACMLIPGISTGVFICSYPLWIVPWIDKFHVTHSSAVAGFTVGVLVMALALPIVGACVTRFSARACMATGGILLAAGFLLGSAATSYWQLLTLSATLLACGAALTSVLPAQSVGVRILPHKAGTVSGSVTLGASIGGMAIPALLTAPLTAYGWRVAFLIIAAITFFTIIPSALLVPRDHDRDNGAASAAVEPQGTEAGRWPVLRQRAFWVALICVVPGYFAAGAVQANAVAIAADSGIRLGLAEYLVPIIPAGAIVGSQSLGWLCDRLGYRWVFASAATATALALLALSQHVGFVPMAVAFITLGIILGGVIPVAGFIVAHHFKARAFPRVMGLILLPMYLAMAVGPLIVAWVRDTTGTYSVACGACAALMLLSVIVVLMLGSNPKGLAGVGASVPRP